ncbi:GNAT family N-acetyltransferase [Brassicibacter mesophilus]|uniref:GNAT family N-acetyltransferase n=1 Tax=Brassicibacter mesophilus TaxID=745119 RepID=UPI003D1922B6
MKDEQSLLHWADVVCIGLFNVKKTQMRTFYDTIRNLNFNNKFKFYLGTYKGKPVASSLLFLSNGVAGIYHVATLPEYRSKGIGKQITLAPLYYAKATGYKISTLQATSLGEVIYKKIGFKQYCTLGRYRITG